MNNLTCVYCSHDIDTGDHCGCYTSPMHRECRSTHNHEYAALIDSGVPVCIDCNNPITSWNDLASSPDGVHHSRCLIERLAMMAITEHGDWDWNAIANERHPRIVHVLGDWLASRVVRMPRIARSVDSILSLIFD